MLAIPWISNRFFLQGMEVFSSWLVLQMVALNEAQEMWNIRKSHLLKRIVLLVRQKTLNRHYHTHKTNSNFLRRKSNISAKKKERGCTFFTVQHLWSVLSYFSIADYILPQYFRFQYWKFVSVITTSISSVCPRSCGLFRLPSKCFHLSTSEYLL